jgi:hypothetical protein
MEDVLVRHPVDTDKNEAQGICLNLRQQAKQYSWQFRGFTRRDLGHSNKVMAIAKTPSLRKISRSRADELSDNGSSISARNLCYMKTKTKWRKDHAKNTSVGRVVLQKILKDCKSICRIYRISFFFATQPFLVGIST